MNDTNGGYVAHFTEDEFQKLGGARAGSFLIALTCNTCGKLTYNLARWKDHKWFCGGCATITGWTPVEIPDAVEVEV